MRSDPGLRHHGPGTGEHIFSSPAAFVDGLKKLRLGWRRWKYLKRPFTRQMQAFIIISSLSAIISEWGDLFKCKSDRTVPFLLLLGQKPELYHSPPGPVWPASHGSPIPCAPQAFPHLVQFATLLPAPGPLHSPFVWNTCPSLPHLVNPFFVQISV